MKAQTNQTVANGTMTQAINFPAANCTYNWVNDNPTVGLGPRGSGDIASFKAINTGFAPAVANITATILATPTYGYRTSTKTPRTIEVVDLKTHQNVGEITIPNGQILKMSPDGQILYMKDPANPKVIYLVSTVTNQIADQINVSDAYDTFMLSPDGEKIYLQNSVFSKRKYDQLLVIDVPSRKEEAPMPIDLEFFNPTKEVDPRFFFSKDGSKIYMTTDFGTIGNEGVLVTFDRLAKTVLTKKAARRPTWVLESNDGTKLFISSNTTKRPTQVYDIVTGNLQDLSNDNDYGFRMIQSQDGNYLYTISNSGLLKIDLRDNSSSTFDAGFSPLSLVYMIPNRDRTRIFYLETNTGNVVMIDANDGTMRGERIKINASSLGNPDQDVSSSNIQLSPDGTQLYITSRIEDFATGKNRAYTSVVDVATQQIIKKIDLPSYSSPEIRVYDIEKYCTASTITVKVTVDPDPPTITPSNNTLAAHTTTYGMPSTAGTFTVSGQRINAGILVTPPNGFEVSTNGTTFTNTATVGGSGDVPATTVYIRLKATANVGSTYGGNIVISNGNLSLNKTIPTSTVTQATLTLAATNVTKKYGEVLTGGPGSTAFNPTGLKNNETIGSVTVTYGVGAAARDEVKTHVGSVTIGQPTGGTFLSGNYRIGRSDAADIIVEQATLTVTVDDKQRYYNEADPTFTFKYSGFISPDDESVLTSIPTVFTTATKASPVGKYPINITGGAALNYKIEAVPGTFTIISRSVIPANAFTPNGDGINDTWNIANINQYPKATVQVFARSGAQVFYSLGYTTPWDATAGSGPLPTGTYYYTINLGNGTDLMKGSLLVIR